MRHADRELNLYHAPRWPSERISERDIPILGHMMCFLFVRTCGPDVVSQPEIARHEQFVNVNCPNSKYHANIAARELRIGEVQ